MNDPMTGNMALTIVWVFAFLCFVVCVIVMGSYADFREEILREKERKQAQADFDELRRTGNDYPKSMMERKRHD